MEQTRGEKSLRKDVAGHRDAFFFLICEFERASRVLEGVESQLQWRIYHMD